MAFVKAISTGACIVFICANATLASAQGDAQQPLMLFHSQSSYLSLSDPSAETVSFVSSIMSKTGLPMRFEVFSANVQTASASIRGGRRLILYNPAWMTQLVAAARTNWAMVQILAHEVGHHLSFHEGSYSNDVSTNHRRELEADYFSGYILARMGASLQDTTAGGRALAQEDSVTHPSSARRIGEMARGWQDALGKSAIVTGATVPTSGTPPPPKGGGGFGRSYWEHNGSTMLLVGGGSTRKIYYHQPREAMLRAGASPGTLLFAGERFGDNYRGISHIFTANCGRYFYEVEGRVEPGDQKVVLRGKAPRVNSRCQVFGYLDDVLVFSYVRAQ